MATIKVRIAVAVDAKGKYAGYGFSGMKDWIDAGDSVLESVDPGEVRYWLEAEVPLPTVTTIAAEVKETA